MSDDLVRRLYCPPFGTETSERNLMVEAADRILELEAALHRIEYLDRPQVRGLPRRKTIQEIARAALEGGKEQC